MVVDFFGYFQIEASYIMTALAGVALISLILTVVAIVKTSKMRKKYNQFMQNSDGTSIEKLLLEKLENMDKLQEECHKNADDIANIYEKLQYSVSKVGLVKYDAFHEMGGKLSFALCMLNETDTGCLVNVMHSNNGCFAYVKEIIHGKSYIELGDEEEKALKEALAGPEGDADLIKNKNNEEM